MLFLDVNSTDKDEFDSSLYLKVSDAVKEQHQFVVKLRFLVYHFLSRSSQSLSVALALLDSLKHAQNIAKVAPEQVNCQIKRLVVGAVVHVERQSPCLTTLLLDDKGTVRVENHWMLERDAQTLTQFEAHQDDLAE